MDLNTNLVEKWQPILEHDDLPSIGDTQVNFSVHQLLSFYVSSKFLYIHPILAQVSIDLKYQKPNLN